MKQQFTYVNYGAIIKALINYLITDFLMTLVEETEIRMEPATPRKNAQPKEEPIQDLVPKDMEFVVLVIKVINYSINNMA